MHLRTRLGALLCRSIPMGSIIGRPCHRQALLLSYSYRAKPMHLPPRDLCRSNGGLGMLDPNNSACGTPRVHQRWGPMFGSISTYDKNCTLSHLSVQPLVRGVAVPQKMAWEVRSAPSGARQLCSIGCNYAQLRSITQSLPRPGHGKAARCQASTVWLADTLGTPRFRTIGLSLPLFHLSVLLASMLHTEQDSRKHSVSLALDTHSRSFCY